MKFVIYLSFGFGTSYLANYLDPFLGSCFIGLVTLTLFVSLFLYFLKYYKPHFFTEKFIENLFIDNMQGLFVFFFGTMMFLKYNN